MFIHSDRINFLFCLFFSKTELSSLVIFFQAILSAQNMGLEGDIKIPGPNNLNVKLNGNKLTAAQLGRHRRQFLTYSKMHPSSDTSQVASLFVQFLNSSLSS